jgi:hypothetical protein
MINESKRSIGTKIEENSRRRRLDCKSNKREIQRKNQCRRIQ